MTTITKPHPAIIWLRGCRITEISPLGEAVARLFHHVLGQIYRLEGADKKVDWSNPCKLAKVAQ